MSWAWEACAIYSGVPIEFGRWLVNDCSAMFRPLKNGGRASTPWPWLS